MVQWTMQLLFTHAKSIHLDMKLYRLSKQSLLLQMLKYVLNSSECPAVRITLGTVLSQHQLLCHVQVKIQYLAGGSCNSHIGSFSWKGSTMTVFLAILHSSPLFQ